MPDRVQIGHIRPQPNGFGGVVNGPSSSGGVDVQAPTIDAAQDAAVAAAKDLGWSPPYRWDGPDEAGAYELIASDTALR